MNLLGNAVKFTERGDVGVRAILESETPGHAAVRFEVVDTGIGIAPEALRRIFDRFGQADDSITRRYGGTGLGTTISKEIIEMMGGKIGVHSTQGAGSTFWFSIEFEKQRAASRETAGMEACLTKPLDTRRLFDLFVRLVWTFLKGSREKIRELERAVSDGDVEGARRAAHALKGNSGQIGAFALMRACDRLAGIRAPELERSGRSYLEAIREEFSRASMALNRQFQVREPAVS